MHGRVAAGGLVQLMSRDAGKSDMWNFAQICISLLVDTLIVDFVQFRQATRIC